MITISGITISKPNGDLSSTYFQIYNTLYATTVNIPYTGQTSITYNEPNNGIYNVTLYDGTSTSTCEPMMPITAQTTGFNFWVLGILNDNDKYLCIGSFMRYSGHTTYTGETANRVLRLSTNGDIDTTFSSYTGFNNTTYCIIKDSNGKYLIGGNFTTYSGVSAYGIIRLNSNGTIDTSFNSGSGFGTSPHVESIIEDSTGKYLIGGSFTTYSGVTKNHIIRLNNNGTIDNSFDSGPGFDTFVKVRLFQDSGDKYLICGDFNTYSGVTGKDIIRLNYNGTIDNTFNRGSGFNGSIDTIIQDSGGKYLIGGNFTTYSGITVPLGIVRLNSGGTIDSSFSVNTGFNNNVLTILQDSGGKYVIGGIFTTYSGVSANYIIRLNNNGSIDTSFNCGSGFNNWVYSIVEDSNNDYIVGGKFTICNSKYRYRIAKLNYNGSLDNTF